MHGRQKVERSEEEEIQKHKERNKKVSAYQRAMKMIFDKRAKDELDEEILMISSQVLASNPDISTLWNIRKQTLIRIKASDLTSFKEKFVPKELDFTEFCLKTNPKSYGSWQHRYWLMIQTDFERVADELKLCAKYLEYDDRNFHGWDYRRFLLDNCSLVTLDQELNFTTEKISSNFSNFSSWHLRSKLLPRLSRDYLLEELELIRNAVFTDPKDQSAWLYHMWLLKSQIPHENPHVVFISKTNEGLMIVFNIRVQDPTALGLKVQIEKTELTTWSNPWANTRSKLWVLKDAGLKDIESIKVSGESLKMEFKCDSIEVKLGEIHNKFPKYFDDETKPKSSQLESLLREELSWVLELHELEPDIKWPVLTAVTLMRLINFLEFKPQIDELLKKLKELDPKRIHYYNDLGSKYVMEWILASQLNDDMSNEIMCLRGLNLTALYYPERLCYKKNIDCGDNKLKNCASISAFRLCEGLDLSNNSIQSTLTNDNYIKSLRHLKNLNLTGNALCNLTDFEEIRHSFGKLGITVII